VVLRFSVWGKQNLLSQLLLDGEVLLLLKFGTLGSLTRLIGALHSFERLVLLRHLLLDRELLLLLHPLQTLLPPLPIKKKNQLLLEFENFKCSPPPSLLNLLSLKCLVLLCRLLLDGKILLRLQALAGAVSRLRAFVVAWNCALLPPRQLLLGSRGDFCEFFKLQEGTLNVNTQKKIVQFFCMSYSDPGERERILRNKHQLSSRHCRRWRAVTSRHVTSRHVTALRAPSRVTRDGAFTHTNSLMALLRRRWAPSRLNPKT
jgi:hypothetical protein